MSESALSITFVDLQKEVGAFLGYGVDDGDWTSAQVAELDRYIQSGIRQFYYPPEVNHEWSFLKPTTTLDTTAEQAIDDLPDNFGFIAGNFYFEPNVTRRPVVIVSEARIYALGQLNTDSGPPQYACIRRKAEADGSDGQRFEVVWYPTPDKAYTLTYTYEAYNGKLTTDKPYPLGGMKFSELIVESCLSVAEQRANDEVGIHTTAFKRLLASAISQDQRQGARNYGHMGGSIDFNEPCRMRSGEVTYKGSTW
ncbi:hypothetical protein [Cerasicoccus frondis]|uniref:phage adaptor protein n=1 Tax=Cerasicoccus frondis TaxID=490090 RepID=UPI002852B990|nr:hypothetical protein [Cerasicoccus frondis]